MILWSCQINGDQSYTYPQNIFHLISFLYSEGFQGRYKFRFLI